VSSQFAHSSQHLWVRHELLPPPQKKKKIRDYDEWHVIIVIIIIIIKKYPKVELKIKDIVVAGMNTNPGGVPT